MFAPACAGRAISLPSALLDYFRKRLGVDDLAFAAAPTLCPGGWVAEVFHFRLESRNILPAAFQGTLTIRAYSSSVAKAQIQHELEVLEFLSGLGYPVPRPLFLEEDGALFGGPFMTMTWVPGRALLDLLLHQITSVLWAPARMAEAQVRLHQLPPRGFPSSETPFLDRSLAALRDGLPAQSGRPACAHQQSRGTSQPQNTLLGKSALQVASATDPKRPQRAGRTVTCVKTTVPEGQRWRSAAASQAAAPPE
jgi:hypothetical protein